MISIGGITLDSDMIWTDETNWNPVVSSAGRTIGGKQVVQEKALQGARPITLEGYEDSGWQKRSTVLALKALAAVPGATYSFIYESFSAMVRFRHEDGNSVDFTQLYGKVNPDGDFWYYGKILLQTV